MIEPCQFASPCLEPDYRNLSVEAPDGVFYWDFFFWGFDWGSPQDDPPLGSDWKNWTALGAAQSTLSPVAADQAAAAAQNQELLDGGAVLGCSPVGGNCGHGALINPHTGQPYIPKGGTIIGFSGYSCVNVPYSFTIGGTGFKAPFTFSLFTGTLPTGLTLDGSGLLSGTPTTAGEYSFTVNVVDASGVSVMQAMTFEVLGLNNSSVLTAATVGAAYSEQLDSGGVVGEYFITAGALPAGLTLGQYDGKISGTPTAPGPFHFTVSVQDVFTNTCSKDFTLIVNPGGGGPVVTLANVLFSIVNYSGNLVSTLGDGNTFSTGPNSARCVHNFTDADCANLGQCGLGVAWTNHDGPILFTVDCQLTSGTGIFHWSGFSTHPESGSSSLDNTHPGNASFVEALNGTAYGTAYGIAGTGGSYTITITVTLT